MILLNPVITNEAVQQLRCNISSLNLNNEDRKLAIVSDNCGETHRVANDIINENCNCENVFLVRKTCNCYKDITQHLHPCGNRFENLKVN